MGTQKDSGSHPGEYDIRPDKTAADTEELSKSELVREVKLPFYPLLIRAAKLHHR